MCLGRGMDTYMGHAIRIEATVSVGSLGGG